MFRNQSLRFKIRLFVAFFLLIIVVMGIWMLYLAHHYLKEELMNRGQVIVRRLAESHSYQVSLGLADELEPILQRIIQTEEGIEYVEFVDSAGRIIQTTDGKHKAQSDPGRRPAAYGRVSIEQLRNSKVQQGLSMEGQDGMELYHFYAPVVSASGSARDPGSVDLSLVGETNPQNEKK